MYKKLLLLLIVLILSITTGCTCNVSDGKVYLNCHGDILPCTDSTYDVGAFGNEFATGYFDVVGATQDMFVGDDLVVNDAVNVGGTLTANNPYLNEAVAMTVTSTNLNLVDDNTFLKDLLGRQPTYELVSLSPSTTLVGSGLVYGTVSGTQVLTGVTACSSALAYYSTKFVLSTSGGNTYFIDFSKPFTLYFSISRSVADAEVIAYIQFKGASTIGAAATKCIALKIVNNEIWTETYGTALGNIDTGIALPGSSIPYRIKIVHTPSVPKDEFYINTGAGFVLRATEATSANIPQTQATTICYLCVSIANGVTGGVNAQFLVSPIEMSIETN